ncbi:MAG TPA: nucleoside deaminase [Candidatus Limnocylindrales bacterium]|nr:nucleoside deaminase [Candidatus Limnocylindrales bacterium]
MPAENAASNPFMARAIALALENIRSGMGGPFAALVVKGGGIISEGTNRVTSANDPTAHAEIIAIREACRKLGRFDLHGCEIYTTCEPCPMCLGAIYWARLEKIYFASTAADAAKIGFDDSLIYDEIHRSIGERRIPLISLMRGDAMKVFRTWDAKQDKIPY